MSEHSGISETDLFQDASPENDQTEETAETSENQNANENVDTSKVVTGTDGRVGEGVSAENVAHSSDIESEVDGDNARLEAGGRRGSSNVPRRPLGRELNWLNENKAHFDSLFSRGPPTMSRSISHSNLAQGLTGARSDEQDQDLNDYQRQLAELREQLTQAQLADKEKDKLLAHTEAVLQKKTEEYDELENFRKDLKNDAIERDKELRSKVKQLRDQQARADHFCAETDRLEKMNESRGNALLKLRDENKEHVKLYTQVTQNAISRENDIEVMQGQIETQKRDLMRLRDSDENYNKAMEDMATEVQTYQNELERIRLEEEAKERENQKLKERLQRRDERLLQQEMQKTELTRKRQQLEQKLQEMQTLALDANNDAQKLQEEINVLRQVIKDKPEGEFDRASKCPVSIRDP